MSELEELRAHVAALVKFAWHKSSCPMPDHHPIEGFGCRCGYQALRDAPDLAALVAREQARDAVIAAARAVSEQSGIAHDDLAALGQALAARDAVEQDGE